MGKKWIPTPEILKDIEQMAMTGLDEQDIAWNLGIHPTSFSTKKHDFPQIEERITRGCAQGIRRATSSLLKQVDSGNLEATRFFLKNRRPETWNNDVQSQAQIQINLSRLNDSQLLDELRGDASLLNSVGGQIPQAKQVEQTPIGHPAE